jgi:hypothetical protein
MVDSGAAGPLTEISAGASSAIRSAIQTLMPYANEDRVAALVRKLNAIRDPEGDSDELAKALVETEAIAKSENISVGVRDRTFRASMELQRSYLAKHSGGASVWEHSARPAGRVAA